MKGEASILNMRTVKGYPSCLGWRSLQEKANRPFAGQGHVILSRKGPILSFPSAGTLTVG